MTESKENDNSSAESQVSFDEFIDIKYIFWIWIKWSWIAIPLVIIGTYFGYRDLNNFVPMHEAKMTVKAGGGQATQASQLNQIASVFGGGGGQAAAGGTFERLQLILKKPTLALILQEKYGLLQEIYKENWDEKNNSWIEPSGPEFEKRESRNKFFKQPQWKAPNIESLANHIGTKIQFREMRSLGFIEVYVSDIDPYYARRLLKLAYFEADRLLRKQDRDSTNKRIAYLTKKIDSVKNIARRGSLIGLLSKEETNLMLLDNDDSYAAKIVDPIFVSSIPTSPNARTLFLFPIGISVFIGFSILTLLALFLRESSKKK